MYIISYKKNDVITGKEKEYFFPACYTLAVRNDKNDAISYPCTEENGHHIYDETEKMYKVYSFESEYDVRMKCAYFPDAKRANDYTKYLSEHNIDYSVIEPNYSKPDAKAHYIYVLANPYIKNVLYVNTTNKDAWIEAEDLYSSTGVPSPYFVVAIKKVKDYNHAAFYLENVLSPYRIIPQKSFYEISLNEINNIINSYKD